MQMKTLTIGVISLALASCAASPVGEERRSGPIVYPPPPDEPRYIYERTIHGSADVEAVDSETKWRRALTGERATTLAFAKPFDVDVCHGIVFVSDTVNRKVFVFDVPHGEFRQIGTEEPGVLRKPMGLATDEECNLYVADQTGRRVVKYDQQGEYLTAFGGEDLFDRLSHVAVDSARDRIYAVDTGGVRSQRHHVRVFNGTSGELLFDIGIRGEGEAEFNLPLDIELDADGNLVIVDGGNFRVQTIGPDGEFIRGFGQIGDRTGQFARPKGLGIDPDGNLYIADAAHGNFQIFSPAGQLLMFIGGRSYTPGPANFMLTAGLAVDEDGRVYVVDQYFRKIDVFRPAKLGVDEGFLGGHAR